MIRLFTFCIAYLLVSCSAGRQDNNTEQKAPPPSDLSGKELALAHCSRCHAYVPPEILPKADWQDVLPAMGHRMGIYKDASKRDSLFGTGPGAAIIRDANIYPGTPVLAREDWDKIAQYFFEHAPDSVSPPLREKKIRMGLRHFKYREAPFAHRPALTGMVRILPDNRGIVFSDGKGGRSALTFLKPNLEENYTVWLRSTPVQFDERPDALHLTTIGKGVFPTDAPDGAMQHWVKEGERAAEKYKPVAVTIPDLQRPVCTVYADLNNDGQEDMVICEFGGETGRLAWYENDGKGKYTKKVLREKPGAITAIIRDANNDGLPDIYVLMAQGDEGIFLYENQGGGVFREKRLLTFSPLNGSQYMELADFNNDGFDDIVYVCGDNADKSPILKNYHGIYIFLNDGKQNFEQAYFYQMNGAYKAIVRDYDMDGDLDIAAISFFPDYIRYPEESFVYLENKGKLRFEDYSFPEAPKGRWVVMDAGDMDGDGDIDLVLGSFVYFIAAGDTTGLGQQWLSTGPSVIVLENTIR